MRQAPWRPSGLKTEAPAAVPEPEDAQSLCRLGSKRTGRYGTHYQHYRYAISAVRSRQYGAIPVIRAQLSLHSAGVLGVEPLHSSEASAVDTV